MADAVIRLLERVFGSAHAAVVFFGSMIPVTEQRATIPLGIHAFDMAPPLVFLLALAGSLIPSPVLLLFFTTVLRWLQRFRFLDWFTGFVERRIRRNVYKFDKKARWFLILFVAVPLPGTGVWTGSAVASTMGLPFRQSLLCVLAGATLSATVLTAVFSAIRYRAELVLFFQGLL